MSKVLKITPACGDVSQANVPDSEIKFYLRLLTPYNSLAAQACAAEYFRRLLVRDHTVPLPYADPLIKGLIRCLRVSYGNIRRDAAWALTNCACSPHNICFKIIQYGGLEALIECATVTDGETRDQVFWTIGNIALDCPLCQAKVRDSAALSLMIGVLVGPMFSYSKWKRNLVWAMTQILRGGIRTLHPMFVQAALRGLYSLLYVSDSKLLTDAVWAIAYLADDSVNGRQIDAVLATPNLLERLMELLDEPDTLRAALRAVGNLVAGGDNQTQAVLDAGLLPRIIKLFHEVVTVNQRREIAWIMSNVAAGSFEQIDQLFESENIINMLTETFDHEDYRVRKEIGWTVANALTGASVKRSRWLCSSHILSVVPQILTLHNELDLVERLLYAIETLMLKRINCMPVLISYRIIDTVHQLCQDNDCDIVVRARAEAILNAVEKYQARQIPQNTYTFVR